MSRVLLLYEHDELAERERHALRASGDEVLAQRVGELKLDAARSFSPDVILVEIPTNGLLSTIRERILGDPELRDRPVVALTESEALARSILAQAYLSPEAPSEALLEIVEKLSRVRLHFQ